MSLRGRRGAGRRRTASGGASNGQITGTARLGRRTKDLVPRLKPGNIAVIDHDDLDRVAAESLVEHGVAAIVNAGRSITGRYPNLGPLIVARANVVLVDDAGPDAFERIPDGARVTVEGERILVDGEPVAKGVVLTEDAIRAQMDAAKRDLSRTVEAFAENTLDYVVREQDILLEAVRLPDLRTEFAGRHALVVTRGHHYKDDLRALRMYVNEMRPVIVAVDGAADACLDEGMRPDIIVGDMDSVSTRALLSGAEIVVHPMGDWRRKFRAGQDPGPPPNAANVEALGLDYHVVTADGMSEDIGLLIAHELGAELVVAVGSHNSLVEFLDKGRQGMASTFLARLRIGPSLVDAKGVSQLYRTVGVRRRDLVLLVVAALVVMVIVSSISEPMRLYWETVWESIRVLLFRIRGLF